MKSKHFDIFSHVGITPKKIHHNEIRSVIHAFEKKNEQYWQKEGFKKALRIFHAASKRIPAYADFLKKNKFDPHSVMTLKDFERIPILTKHNYIEQYPLIDRMWERRSDLSSMVASSSGTTGEAIFWPRGHSQETEATIFHELIYRELFSTEKKSTLVIIGFPMGVYVSGLATVLPSWAVSASGHRLTLVSPGMNKVEIIRSMEEMSKLYEQTILIGHPFFLKDVLETALQKNTKLQSYNLRLLCCSEAFSEEWRSYVSKIFTKEKTPSIFSTYGSSEFLLIGTETTFSIAIKNLFEKNTRQCMDMFSTEIVPAIFQYNPLIRYIEEDQGNLLFTANSGIPLVRYALGDRGSLLKYEETKNLLSSRELKNLSKWKLPLVALKGRSDYAVIFYGANIYIEHIRSALEHKEFFPSITGKFRMGVFPNKQMDPVLQINIELHDHIKPSLQLAEKIREHVSKHLLQINIEYSSSVQHVEKDLKPQIYLHTYQSQPYFTPGLKPNYIIK